MFVAKRLLIGLFQVTIHSIAYNIATSIWITALAVGRGGGWKCLRYVCSWHVALAGRAQLSNVRSQKAFFFRVAVDVITPSEHYTGTDTTHRRWFRSPNTINTVVT